MIGLGMSAVKVCLAVEPCDIRKDFNGVHSEVTFALATVLAVFLFAAGLAIPGASATFSE